MLQHIQISEDAICIHCNSLIARAEHVVLPIGITGDDEDVIFVVAFTTHSSFFVRKIVSDGTGGAVAELTCKDCSPLSVHHDVVTILLDTVASYGDLYVNPKVMPDDEESVVLALVENSEAISSESMPPSKLTLLEGGI